MNIRTLGGADAVTVNNLTGTGLRSADVDLWAIGGAGDGSLDTVTANGSDRREVLDVTRSGAQVVAAGLPVETTMGGEGANDLLRVNTLGGNDEVAVAPDVSELIRTAVDLGSGQRQ